MSLDSSIRFFEDQVQKNKYTSSGPFFFDALVALREKKTRLDEINRPITIVAPITAPYSNETTSKAAAKKVEITLNKTRNDVLQCITRGGEHGRTGWEIAEMLDMNLYTAKPRCTELRDAGYIIDSGRTRDNAHGNPEIVWVRKP